MLTGIVSHFFSLVRLNLIFWIVVRRGVFGMVWYDIAWHGIVWYGIVEYCGLDTLILIKGRRRCQIFAQFETISEYINSSVEKALSGLPAPNIPTSHIGNENISKWSN